LEEYQQTLQAGFDGFRHHCQIQSQEWEENFDNDQLSSFWNDIIFPEVLSLNAFALAYPRSRTFARPPIKLSGDMVNDFRLKINKAARNPDYKIYATVLGQSFEAVWLAIQKQQAGDTRDLDDLIHESVVRTSKETEGDTTTIYEVYKRQPVYPDYIYRHITSMTEEVEVEYFFGVDPNDKRQWSAWADEYLDLFFSLPDSIGADKRDIRRIAYLHPDPLPSDLAEEDLAKICTGGWRLCLAWGPKYTPLLRKGCLALNRFEPVKPKSGPDTDYPGHWWGLLDSEVEAHREILTIFVDTLARAEKHKGEQTQGDFIITTFENLYKDQIKKDAAEKRARAKEYLHVSVNESIRVKQSDEEDSGIAIGDMIPAEPLFRDFGVDLPELDELFPDKVRNYIARNLEESSAAIAKHLKLSPRRVRQIRQKVQEVLKSTIEPEYFYGVYLPGPADDIKRAKALIYRIPQYKQVKRVGQCTECYKEDDIYCAVPYKVDDRATIIGTGYDLICKTCCLKKIEKKYRNFIFPFPFSNFFRLYI
jgi:hypothetical protein